MMLSSMVTAMPPSRASVVAAFLLLGFRNAGTPLLIASTPVSAAHPDENARRIRKPSARPVEALAVERGSALDLEAARSACGQVAEQRARSSPTAAIPMIATMKSVGRDGEERARLAHAAQVHRHEHATTSRPRPAPRARAATGSPTAAYCAPEETDTATVST